MHTFRITDNQFLLSEERAPPPLRRKYKKSTNGCSACKRRKIKCDEVRPVCYNCSVHFRGVPTCDWPQDKGRPWQSDRFNMISSTTPASVSSSAPPPISRRRGSTTSPSITRATSISSDVVSSAIDPFDSLPPTTVPNAQELLHHYITVAAWEYSPISLRKRYTNPLLASWPTLAGADSLLFHSNLQISARSLERREGVKRGTYSDIVSRECIRLLRDRVQDPVLGISNHTLGAIARMMEVEFDKRNHMAVKMHLGGLISIIKLRGGLDSIRSSCTLTMTAIIWRTLLITNLCPYRPTIEDTLEDPIWIKSMLPPTSAYVNLPSATDLYIDRATWDGLAITKSHIEQIGRIFQAGEEPNLILTDALAALFWQRYTYLPPEGSLQLSDATRLVTILFLCISNPECRSFLFEHPLAVQSAKKIVGSLRAALDLVLDLEVGIERSEMALALLAWNFLVGAMAAQKMVEERRWFVEGLRHVTLGLNVSDWKELRELLLGIVWLEVWHDEAGQQVWEEVMMGNNGGADCFPT